MVLQLQTYILRFVAFSWNVVSNFQLNSNGQSPNSVSERLFIFYKLPKDLHVKWIV